MNLHCVIPKANFNEEKQTLLLAYCALVGRPFPIHLVDCLGMNYQNFFVAFLFHAMAQISVAIQYYYILSILWHWHYHELTLQCTVTHNTYSNMLPADVFSQL